MNIPKIVSALSFIGDDLIGGASDIKKKSRVYLLKYGALAACAVLAVGLAAAYIAGRPGRGRNPINTSPFPATEPTVTEEANTAPSPAEDEVTAPSTEIPENTTTETPVTVMPPPFSEDGEVGGDANSAFYATVDLKLGYLDSRFCDIAGWDETEEWLGATASVNSDLTAVDELGNLYSFIRHFDIPDSAVREILVKTRIGSEEDDFSDEEIELLLSDDAEAVAEHFAADTAIVKGKNIYSPKWLYIHPVSDYADAGIDSEDVEKVLSEIDSFGLTDEAREAFEKKLSETMTYTDGVLVYNDGTIVYNHNRPLLQKEFTVIDEFYDPDADGHIFYLVSDDKSDKNIYACFYMFDQLIAAGCDGPKAFLSSEAVFRFTDYYTEKQPAPIGAVVRLAWDGLADTEYEILRLPMLSRIQFSESETPYTQSELEALNSSLEGKYLDAVELVEEMWSPYRNVGDENTVEVGGTEPYQMIKKTDFAESFSEMLKEKAPIKYPDSVMTYYGGELYAETGYTLSEEEFAEFMYCAIAQPAAFRGALPEGVEADYSDLIGTPEFKTGNFTLTDRPITGELQSNCFIEARLWQLIGEEFIFARLDNDIALPDGTVLHGWLFRRVGKSGEEPESGGDSGEYPEKLDFLNHLSEFYDGDYVYWQGGRYRYNRIILTKQNCEDFAQEAEYIGDSVRDYERRDDLCANILESGVPLYRYGGFILAIPNEPELVGVESYGGGQTAPVYIYGYLYQIDK